VECPSLLNLIGSTRKLAVLKQSCTEIPQSNLRYSAGWKGGMKTNMGGAQSLAGIVLTHIAPKWLGEASFLLHYLD